MAFINSSDREAMIKLLDQLPPSVVNDLEGKKYKGVAIIRYLHNYNDNIPEILNLLEHQGYNQSLKPEGFGLKSFKEIETKEQFDQHFKDDYNLLNSIKVMIKHLLPTTEEFTNSASRLEKAQLLYSKYDKQHSCLELAFIPVKFQRV